MGWRNYGLWKMPAINLLESTINPLLFSIDEEDTSNSGPIKPSGSGQSVGKTDYPSVSI